jgi:hypothetical protein
MKVNGIMILISLKALEFLLNSTTLYSASSLLVNSKTIRYKEMEYRSLLMETSIQVILLMGYLMEKVFTTGLIQIDTLESGSTT